MSEGSASDADPDPDPGDEAETTAAAAIDRPGAQPEGRIDRLVERVGGYIVDRPGRLVAVFLVLTGVFLVGLGGVGTESGTDQFTTDVPAQAAFEDVQREFSQPFATPTGSTQLIQTEQNVLAKPALLRMLRLQRSIEDRDGLRVTATSSPADAVATQLDPTARTTAERIDAVERATPARIDAAVARAAQRPGFADSLSNDFNAQSARASAAIGVVTHRVPTLSTSGMPGGDSPLTGLQLDTRRVVTAETDGQFRVFGSGIIGDEFQRVIFDSLFIVVPAAAVFILLFLLVAYRDPFDLLLGVVSLVMAIVWTFGFTGVAGIPFSQLNIAIPPLLLAVGIDFGIHSINRYREERAADVASRPAMRITLRQLLVAFFIVTGTTVIGFGANLTSSLGPIRDFGLTAAVGIVFTFLIFGVFLPAAKLVSDRARARVGLDRDRRPLGGEGSLLGRALQSGVVIGRRAPTLFLIVVLVATVGLTGYATGVGTSFSQEDFLPPEETPAYLNDLPEPFRPGEYTATRDLNFLEDNFAAGNQQSVTVFVEGPMTADHALEAIHRAGRDPPPEFIATDRRADSQSIVTVVQSRADQDPEFAALVRRNDRDGNGIPDHNLREVYAALERSPAAPQVERFLADDRRSARVVYTAEGDAATDALTTAGETVADRQRFRATATGQTIVFQAVSDVIFASAATSLLTALGLTAVFLVVIYRLLTGFWSLGIVNLVPVVVALALLVASMRYLDIPLNSLTATILSITIGLGIDYSVHVVHRFADEYRTTGDEFTALVRTVRGTGGALTGSMLTTVTGIGVLVLAITPILGQFGLLTGLSVLYAFFASIIVTPSVVVVWARTRDRLGLAAPDPA